MPTVEDHVIHFERLGIDVQRYRSCRLSSDHAELLPHLERREGSRVVDKRNQMPYFVFDGQHIVVDGEYIPPIIREHYRRAI